MTAAQLDLLSSIEPLPAPSRPSGRQHTAILEALDDAGERGCSGEEAAFHAGIRLAASATTRLEEMADRHRFGVPLVYRSARKLRPTASGRLAYVWFLTGEGQRAVRSGT